MLGGRLTACFDHNDPDFVRLFVRFIIKLRTAFNSRQTIEGMRKGEAWTIWGEGVVNAFYLEDRMTRCNFSIFYCNSEAFTSESLRNLEEMFHRCYMRSAICLVLYA